jgi:signal transduction histidine kinase
LEFGWSNLARAVLVEAWVVAALIHLVQRPESRLLTWPLNYMLLEALAGLSLAYRAWRTEGEGRLAWWLLALSTFLEVPNLLMGVLQVQGLVPPRYAGLSSLMGLATGILVLMGVLSFPKGPERGGMFRRRLLDSLVFATALLFLLWVMGVQGSLKAAAHGVGLRVFVAYLNVALLGGGLVFITSYHPDRIQGPLGWLGASALAWLMAISCWTLSGLPSVVATQPWIFVAGAIPLFQGLAAWSPRSVHEAMAQANPGRRASGLWSYLPVSIAVLVLAGMLAWVPQNVTREAYALFLVMVLFLLLRQFQAILDLQFARRTLADQVEQRTRTLEQAQDTLMRTERMNTLALMGAGLAHDLNNLMAAVKASADLALSHLEEGLQPGAGDLARIAKSADRAALLTHQLMEFAHRGDEELLPMDLGRELREMEGLFRLLLPRSVELRIEVPAGEALVVRSSRRRLEQMLVNLVANARDAMPGGGLLCIRVARAEGDWARVEVADTGIGMAPDILSRIFEPFFTTKAPGKGTGLGLPSLKAMVEEGGGRLDVETEPGQGSRFHILLPLVRGQEVSRR